MRSINTNFISDMPAHWLPGIYSRVMVIDYLPWRFKNPSSLTANYEPDNDRPAGIRIAATFTRPWQLACSMRCIYGVHWIIRVIRWTANLMINWMSYHFRRKEDDFVRTYQGVSVLFSALTLSQIRCIVFCQWVFHHHWIQTITLLNENAVSGLCIWCGAFGCVARTNADWEKNYILLLIQRIFQKLLTTNLGK